MSFSMVGTKTTSDANSAADINQLQANITTVKGDDAATSGNFTITDTGSFSSFFVDISSGTATGTLPTLADNLGREINFFVSSISAATTASYNFLLDGEGAETLNGTITQSIVNKYDYLSIIGNSNEWFIKHFIASYDTGWINRSDWTNVHIGSDDIKNADSNVTHNLNVNLSDIVVKILISTDGNDNNSFEINMSSNAAGVFNFTIYQVDTNSLTIQTGSGGLTDIDSSGAAETIDTEDWFYKIKVYRIK